jgi:hypothetical protein
MGACYRNQYGVANGRIAVHERVSKSTRDRPSLRLLEDRPEVDRCVITVCDDESVEPCPPGIEDVPDAIGAKGHVPHGHEPRVESPQLTNGIEVHRPVDVEVEHGQ